LTVPEGIGREAQPIAYIGRSPPAMISRQLTPYQAWVNRERELSKPVRLPVQQVRRSIFVRKPNVFKRLF